MRRREPPAGQRMKIVGADSPDLVPDPETEKKGMGYWGFLGWWFGILTALAALLGLVAGFFGLYLAAVALLHAMGL